MPAKSELEDQTGAVGMLYDGVRNLQRQLEGGTSVLAGDEWHGALA